MSSHRQTATYLKARFAEVGIALQARHGQNFLIDLNLLELLAEAADVGPRDVVLEVGTGTGGLTSLIAPQAAAVVTVEIDRRLHQLAYEELIDFENIVMLQQDALKTKNTMDPLVLAAVRTALDAKPDRRFKLVANLPYSVATPVISNLLAGDLPPETMTVTIQKELAERVIARPGTKDYGSLSVWVQSQCTAELLRLIPCEAVLAAAESHLRYFADPAQRRTSCADHRSAVFSLLRPRTVRPPAKVLAQRSAERFQGPAR